MSVASSLQRRCLSTSGSSKQWLARQARDHYVTNAQRDDYRSRAAYKLLEINTKYRILRRGDTVVDLGCAPGSWSQVAVELVAVAKRRPSPASTLSSADAALVAASPPLPSSSASLVIGVDLVDVAPLPGVTLITGDLTQPGVQARVCALLHGGRADVVLSDMAHSFSGARQHDSVLQSMLSWSGLLFCCRALKGGGNAVIKSRHGESHAAFVAGMKSRFRRCVEYKPPASRSESAESYVVGIGFVDPKKASVLSGTEQLLLTHLGITPPEALR